MKHVRRVISGSFLALSLVGFMTVAAVSAWAQDEAAESNERPDPPELSRFEPVGEEQLCIRTSRIRQTQVLDDYTILFRMRGGKYFVNRLPHRCYNLGFEGSFSYTLSTSLLCNVDIITVVRTPGFGPSCGLGDFEEYRLKPDEGDESKKKKKKKKKKKDRDEASSE